MELKEIIERLRAWQEENAGRRTFLLIAAEDGEVKDNGFSDFHIVSAAKGKKGKIVNHISAVLREREELKEILDEANMLYCLRDCKEN